MSPRKRAHALTREEILDVSLAIIDEEGLGALTMRRLGTALGVDPMMKGEELLVRFAKDGGFRPRSTSLRHPTPIGRGRDGLLEGTQRIVGVPVYWYILEHELLTHVCTHRLRDSFHVDRPLRCGRSGSGRAGLAEL